MNSVRFPKAPKGGGAQKCKVSVFRIKVDLFRKKSATKFLCVKTFSDKLVRHSLAYLYVHKWLVGDVASYLKFWALKNADFASTFARSASSITLSEKSSKITRKTTTGSLMNLR